MSSLLVRTTGRAFGRGGRRAGVSLLVAVLSMIVIAYFALRPVFIPVVEFSREILFLQTQTLTGIKGQTMLNPGEGLARIDLKLTTDVAPEGWIRVKFELKPEPGASDTYASGIVVFRESREDWRVSLRFQPGVVPAGERFYLRTEAILSSPRDRLFFRYVQTDEYPFGNHYDLDEEIPGQDLYFKQFRITTTPRPFAWAEAIWARLADASRVAQSGATAVLAIPLVLLILSAVVVLVGSVFVAARELTLPVRAIDVLAIALTLVAVSLVLFLPGELPRASLEVGLQ